MMNPKRITKISKGDTPLAGSVVIKAFFEVRDANPNGDPLNGNMPRQVFDGRGVISSVSDKRKIRNSAQDLGAEIFVKSNDRADDGYRSLQARMMGNKNMRAIIDKEPFDKTAFKETACKECWDIRSFGQMFTFKANKTNVSTTIKGPVTFLPTYSVDPVHIISDQITKSVNGEEKEGMASDTMGMNHRVDFGLYVMDGSINPSVARQTGFSQEDAGTLKAAIMNMFKNDASAARPEGSMVLRELIWWQYDEEKLPDMSVSKVRRSVSITANTDTPAKFEDYDIEIKDIEGVTKEVYLFE